MDTIATEIRESNEEKTTTPIIPSKPTQNTSNSWKPRVNALLPNWVTKNLRSSRSWKLIFRCWIAAWISFVILLPHKSLNALGTTAFFATLASLFLPAYLPVQLFLVVAFTLMAGVLIGWGLGVAAMRAANAVRSAQFLQSVLQEIQRSIASDPALRAHPNQAITLATFRGAFLETHPSVIYGCFLAVGAFFFGLIRAYAPKLLFMSIFGTIAMDIFCTIGPLLPVKNYKLLESIVKSLATYIAVACLATMLVFPETTNHICMTMISEQLSRVQGLITIQEEVFESDPADLRFDAPLMARIRAARSELIASQQQLSAMISTINGEFSIGQWNGDDVKDVTGLLLILVIRTAALQGFARLVGETTTAAPSPDVPDNNDNEDEASNNSSTDKDKDNPANTKDAYLLKQIQQRRSESEKLHSVHITDLIPVLRRCTHELRHACVDALGAAQASVDIVNTRRLNWSRGEVEERSLKELGRAIESLEGAVKGFKDTHRKALVDPYRALIRGAKSVEEEGVLPLRSLYLSFVFGADLLVVASACLRMMEGVREKVERRRGNRVWAPKGLRMVWDVVFLRTSKEDSGFGEDESADSGNERVDGGYRRDPDSKPPTNGFQWVMDRVHRMWVWCGTAEAKFTFKYVAVTVALWLPAVVKSSARVYYMERGVWALIMAQTTLNIYAADQIFNLLTRLAGTFVGLILGLIAWYAGNGGGNGNPYGAAASVGVLLVPILFVRVFVPPQHLAGVVLGCATFALIVGYSWVDGNTVQVVSYGVGWSVAWKRWVLVMIGAMASFVIMMLPPTSGRKAVRIGNAASIAEFSNIYGFLMSTWISNRLGVAAKDGGEEGAGESNVPASWLPEFRNRLLAQAEKINILRGMTQLARWEGSIRGAWPVEEYARLVDVQSDMISSLAHLGGALGHMEDNWRLTFLHATKVLNPHFISDVIAVFSLVSQSLRTGEPLHAVLPMSLCRRLFSYEHRSDHGQRMIELEQVESLDYMFYATGLIAVYQLLKSLDELHRITKRLCGEVPLAGFMSWREEYERLHSRV